MHHFWKLVREESPMICKAAQETLVFETTSKKKVNKMTIALKIAILICSLHSKIMNIH